MQTVYGIVADPLGTARSAGRVWKTPSAQIAREQDGFIGVDIDHNGHWVGEVVDLQRHRGSVWAVCEVDDDVAPEVPVRIGAELRHVEHDLFFSPVRVGGPEDGIVLLSLALTPTPARVAARAVTFLADDVSLAAFRSTDRFERELLKRASRAQSKRCGGPIVVFDADPPAMTDDARAAMHRIGTEFARPYGSQDARAYAGARIEHSAHLGPVIAVEGVRVKLRRP
jgi:hypothetical protein